MSTNELFTIGHSRRDASTFAGLLHTNHIEIVVDVRRRAGSRFTPAFAKTHLCEWLGQEGIEYRRAADLAPSHSLRQREKDGEIDRSEMLVIYREELDDRVDELDELLELAGRKRCCLMCLERDAMECHRSVLAETLAARSEQNVEVTHL